MTYSSPRYRNKPARFQQGECGDLVMVCRKKGGGGGSTTTQYVQSPEQAALYSQLSPIIGNIFPGGEATQNLYDVPGLNYNLPTYNSPLAYGSLDTSGLSYNLPTFQNADVSKYIPTGGVFENVYNKIAPAYWDIYDTDVQDALVNRFAGSGSLGSAAGGLSGAAADTLTNSRTRAGNQIASQAYQSAQAPLLQALQNEQAGNIATYGAGVNAAMRQAELPWQAGIQGQSNALSSAYNAAMAKSNAEYAAGVQKAMNEAGLPWQAKIQSLQYPYQILPGMLGGTMSTPVTTQQSGGKK